MISVTAAVTAELEAFEERLAGVSESSLAAAALALAGRIDGGMADTAFPPALKELREHMDQIRASLPEEVKESRLSVIRGNFDTRHTDRAEGGAAA